MITTLKRLALALLFCSSIAWSDDPLEEAIVPGPPDAASAHTAPADAEPEPYVDDGDPEAATATTATDRTLATTGVPAERAFVFWQSPDHQSFIKPVLQLASLLVGFVPTSEQADELSGRVSTLALARFGLEGELFGFVTFRSVFERNLGFSLARNGPVGTSVWEGTASLQARENYIRLHTGGLSFTGGIFPDPASVDFVSTNILDAFGMDPYVRDPMLVSGFSQGQGVMVRYTLDWLTFGLSFTGGNPLTTSLAFGFGGDVTSLGTLFSAPLRALSNGIPGSDIQLTTLTPSLSVATDVVDVRLAGQFYMVDADLGSDDDESLTGFNVRVSAQLKLLDDALRIYASGAFRRNQQLAVPDLTARKDAYEGVLAGAGFDVFAGRFSAGVQYYYLHSQLSEESELTTHYLNVGATWWLEPPHVSVGVRWARSMADSEPAPPRLEATDSFILSLRLLI